MTPSDRLTPSPSRPWLLLWSLAIGVSVAVTVVSGEGCVDPCVLSGQACNISSDCDGDEVCRFPGLNDPGCPVVTGTCGPGECGSDAECDDGCCNLETRQCGQKRDECAGTPECEDDADCSTIQRCRAGTCRDSCEDDVNCPGSERCSLNCTAPIGAACSIDDTIAECFGGECTDRDADNNEVAAYCTDGCGLDIEGYKSFCPDGFVCVNTGSDVCLKL